MRQANEKFTRWKWKWKWIWRLKIKKNVKFSKGE